MRILYVVSRPLEINTSASIRNRATIEGFLELGHNIDLVTTDPDNKHGNYDASILSKRINTTYFKLGGVQNLAKVGRRFAFLKPLRNTAHKFISNFEIYDNLKGIINHVHEFNIKDEDYDVIISSSDPKSSHLFVNKMFDKKIIKNIPWIQIWGDPFLSDITRKNKKFDNKIKKEENRLLKHATKVIYVSSLTLKNQKKIYPHYADKMFYEPIPYVKEEVYPDVDLKKESLTFLYCGDYPSNIRNIIPLYDAVNSTDHKLIICGHSDINLENTNQNKIYPRVSFKKIKELEKECDVLVHLSNLSGSQIPGKIYQYSGTNKPILFILDGEKDLLKEIFGRYNRFIFSNNSKEDVLQSIVNLKKQIVMENFIPIQNFSPSVIAKRILEEIEGSN
ncbi:hypothetical protein ACFVSS_11560 [Peribacillus butanolivorans]|uniref:hypothetical protein n=1 Tax=Peribacillus butanolivorans TaxID=421767 RepID=UPI0036DC3EC8